MDLTFRTDLGRFNIRVCAVMIHQEALLIMRDEAMPYAYLPGGRIQFQETAEAALKRELKEELKIEAEILRPLWLCQSFFLESASQEKFHELCLYFLVNPNNSERLIQDQTFSVEEGKRTHTFEWIPFSQIQEINLFPRFIQKALPDLPSQLTLITENELTPGGFQDRIE